MHGIEHRIEKSRALRLSAPQQWFSPTTASTLSDAPQVHSQRSRSLVAAFPSPVINLLRDPFQSKFPSGYFALSASRFLRPFGLSAPQPATGLRPAQTASTLQARCGFRNRLRPPLPSPQLPFGNFSSLRIIASASCAADRLAFQICPISSRSPLPVL